VRRVQSSRVCVCVLVGVLVPDERSGAVREQAEADKAERELAKELTEAARDGEGARAEDEDDSFLQTGLLRLHARARATGAAAARAEPLAANDAGDGGHRDAAEDRPPVMNGVAAPWPQPVFLPRVAETVATVPAPAGAAAPALPGNNAPRSVLAGDVPAAARDFIDVGPSKEVTPIRFRRALEALRMAAAGKGGAGAKSNVEAEPIYIIPDLPIPATLGSAVGEDRAFEAAAHPPTAAAEGEGGGSEGGEEDEADPEEA
jgi:hypothetical protein